MKRLAKFLFRFIFFWLIVFFINRVVFLFSAVYFLKDTTFFHALVSLGSGWMLDLSTIGYFLPLPGLLATLAVIFPRRWILQLSNLLVAVFIVIYCLICFGELFLYREWMTKLTMQALLHFRNPAEVFQTAQLHTTILFFLFSTLFAAVYIFFYIKKIADRKPCI